MRSATFGVERTTHRDLTAVMLIVLTFGFTACLTACGTSDAPERTAPAVAKDAKLHPVITRARPGGDGTGVATDLKGPDGQPLRAPCSSCHATKKPTTIVDASELKEVHKGLKVAHGKLACGACHNAPDYDDLRLADGSAASSSA